MKAFCFGWFSRPSGPAWLGLGTRLFSKLFASALVVQQAFGSCLVRVGWWLSELRLRPGSGGGFLKAFCFGGSAGLRVLLVSGGDFLESCFVWKRVEPVARLELRVVASYSWFVELFVLRLVPGLVRLIGLILEVVPRGSGASTRRIGASSHQHVLRSAGGFPGAREGSRLTANGSSSLLLEPESEQLEDHTRWRGSR